jgi:hypothetical protein
VLLRLRRRGLLWRRLLRRRLLLRRLLHRRLLLRRLLHRRLLLRRLRRVLLLRLPRRPLRPTRRIECSPRFSRAVTE